MYKFCEYFPDYKWSLVLHTPQENSQNQRTLAVICNSMAEARSCTYA